MDRQAVRKWRYFTEAQKLTDNHIVLHYYTFQRYYNSLVHIAMHDCIIIRIKSPCTYNIQFLSLCRFILIFYSLTVIR